MEQTKPGGYNVETIILTESSFERKSFIDFSVSEIENEINTESSFQEGSEENKFAVSLSLTIKGTLKDTVIFTSSIKMLGVFEKIGEPALSEDVFKKINAPAIIYPFIRELLYNLALKAGIGNVFLPTINFKP